MPTMTKANVKVIADAVDTKDLRAIELADGWHEVTNCEFVHFAVGEAQSPISPDKLYPSLRYTNEFGKLVRTPLNKILSFSEEPQARR